MRMTELIQNENAIGTVSEMSLKNVSPQDISHQDGFNPQEALSDRCSDDTRGQSLCASEVSLEEQSTASKHPFTKESFSVADTNKKQVAINRRNLRSRRQVAIDDKFLMGIGLSLPSTQFETIICRRTIHKRELSVNIGESYSHRQNPLVEKKIYYDPEKTRRTLTYLHEDDPIDNTPGDISLGMKLNVVDGKVIVQHLKPLEDGKASPAQLTGVVSRGDILLAVNEKSLVGLTLDELMSALSPLSAPNSSGSYRRKLKLRFASKKGLKELRSVEAPVPRETQNSDVGLDIARDMFALFPMVEQAEDFPTVEKSEGTAPSETIPQNSTTIELPTSQKENRLGPSTTGTLDSQADFIANNLSSLRIQERDQFLLEFHSWTSNFTGNDTSFKEGVGCSLDDQENDLSELAVNQPTEVTDVERGAVAGANTLSRKLEDIDRGIKEENPLLSWSSTLSLFSRASRRGKRVFDGASLPARLTKVVETNCEVERDNESDSNASFSEEEEEDRLGGDDLLVRLASNDDVWRKQLIDVLSQLSLENEEEGNYDVSNTNEDINESIANGLGNLFFGEDMTKILKNTGKPRSLPCEEVTSLLCDLATKVSSSIPQEIFALQNKALSVNGYKRNAVVQGEDVHAATDFLMEEAIPVWLKSFAPLPWEHRRVLWPLGTHANVGGSTSASSISDDITLESTGTAQQTTPSRKDIASIVEDREINYDTRNETCFLVTFYFVKFLLPKVEIVESQRNVKSKEGLDNIIVFLGEFGAYLEINKCLVLAAAMRAEVVIDLLLSIAKHDPRHREVMKLMSKSNHLVLYEQSMLSAVLHRLYNITKERSSVVKAKLVEVCAAAFPDIQPWQVQKMCFVNEGTVEESAVMADLYYNYLSLLLNPSDGFEAARRQPLLVKEWCDLSINRITKSLDTGICLQNFSYVASRRSNTAALYTRDLFHLLELSMELKDHTICLDIIDEISLDQSSFASCSHLINDVMAVLRTIGSEAINCHENSVLDKEQVLRRVLGLLTTDNIRQHADVPSVLRYFLEQRGFPGAGTARQQLANLTDIMAEEAVPSDVLDAVASLTDPSLSGNVYELLRKVLRKSAHTSINSDLSKSRMLLKTARQTMAQSLQSKADQGNDGNAHQTTSIWRFMLRGSLSIDK